MSESTTGSARPVKWLMYGLAGVVVAGWSGLLSLYFRGALIWGHLPRGGPEDPKDVGEGLHYTLAGYSAATMAIGTLVVFAVLAAFAALEHKGAQSAKIAAFLVAVLSVAATFGSPVVGWYLD